MDEIKLHNAAKRYVDCSYALGDTSKGFDCLTMVWDFYESLGVKIPHEWNGWTQANYAERWKKGEGRKEIIDYLMTLGKPVEKNFMQRGDLIIFEGTIAGPAIYLGNFHAVRIFETGGKVHSIKTVMKYIKAIRRLI